MESHLDCVLAICPPWDVETPPLGISHLGEFLRCQGFSAKLMDFNIEVFHRLSPEVREVLWSFSSFQLWEERKYLNYDPHFESHFQEAAQALAATSAPLFGFSLYHSNLHFTVEVIQRLRHLRPEAEVVIGGPSCIDEYDREHLSLDVADYMVIGDGERPLLKLLKCKEEGLPPEGIPGLVVLKDLPQPQMVPVEYESNLDVFPFPSYRDFDLSVYLKPSLRIMGSRGCVARCAFCNESHWSGKFRSRSAEHIYAEMTHHANELGIRQFKFSDLLLNGHLKEVSRLCDLILSDGLRCVWHGQGLTRKDMNEELLVKMSQAGCSEVDFGVESGSPAILRRMRKPFTPAIAERVLRASKAAGIKTGVNILVGFPGEGEAEFAETLSFLERNASIIDKVANLSVCFVKPSSDLYLRPYVYKIALPPSSNFWYRWVDLGEQSNRDADQRMTKLQWVVEACERHHIPIEGIHAFQ
jgi:anaerobic magnesium-protoporphyrin IX monomethyl ester cyclase